MKILTCWHSTAESQSGCLISSGFGAAAHLVLWSGTFDSTAWTSVWNATSACPESVSLSSFSSGCVSTASEEHFCLSSSLLSFWDWSHRCAQGGVYQLNQSSVPTGRRITSTNHLSDLNHRGAGCSTTHLTLIYHSLWLSLSHLASVHRPHRS